CPLIFRAVRHIAIARAGLPLGSRCSARAVMATILRFRKLASAAATHWRNQSPSPELTLFLFSGWRCFLRRMRISHVYCNWVAGGKAFRQCLVETAIVGLHRRPLRREPVFRLHAGLRYARFLAGH